MSGRWIEILDTATSGGQVTELMAEAIVRNFNPAVHNPPHIIGHASDYRKDINRLDSRIPVGAWTKELRKVGTKIEALTDEPGKITVPVPAEFKELAGMPEFFKESISKGLYRKRSVGLVGDGEDTTLHHVGWLGAKPPQCKGMTDAELAEHPDFQLLTVELADSSDVHEYEFSEQTMKILTLDQLKNLATTVLPQLKELAEATVDSNDDAQKELDELLKSLRLIFGLPEAADIGQILGAVQAKIAKAEKAKLEAAAIGNQFIGEPTVGNPSEYAEMVQSIKTLELKVKELSETPPPPATTEPATPPANTMPTIGLSTEECQAKANEAKAKLEASKNWLPAFDEGMLKDFAAMANIKSAVGEGSVLDTLVTSLSVIQGLNEMSETMTAIKAAEIELSELHSRVKYLNPEAPAKGTKVPEGYKTQNDDRDVKIREYMEQHPGVNYIDADNLINN